MAKFSYTAVDVDGNSVSGVEEAASKSVARLQLIRRGLEFIEIQEKRGLLDFELTKQRVKRTELMHFSRQLAVFVRAGIPIIDGLETIAEDATNRTFKSALEDMVERLRGGSTFSDAASAHPEMFPNFFLGVLRSAEVTGGLDAVLDQLGDYIERDVEARSKVMSALLYPSIVIVMSLISLTVMITYVLPKFKTFFDGFDAKLPLPTRIVIAAGNFFGNWWAVMLGLIVVLIGSTVVALRTEHGKEVRDTILLRVPLAGDIVREAVLERFCRVLSTMVTAGVPIPEAMLVTADATSNRVYRKGLVEAREAMMRGEGLAEPLSATGLFPPAARQMLRVGENTGSLDEQMRTAAQYFERELDAKIKRFTGILEPAVIVVVGGIVGFIAIALVSAMYGVFHQIRVK